MDQRNDATWDDMVLVGIVARTQGLRGHVFVNPLTDFADERFKTGATVWGRIAGVVTPLHIESLRMQGGRPVVTFAGYADVDRAEELAGVELRIPEQDLQPLADGSWYHHQLVGCVVVTDAGAHVGAVSKVEDGAGGALLVVKGERSEILIPLAEEICTAVDVAGRQIRIAPPPGLLELNETGERPAPNDAARRPGEAGVAEAAEPRSRKFDVITIFPRMVQAGLAEGVVSRGIEQQLLDVAVHDLREFTTDRHRSVDDMPYGGGPGMVMKVEPIVKAVEFVRSTRGEGTVVLLSPQGRRFTQEEAVRLSRLEHLVFVCGRYEGIDDRVAAVVGAEELSIGDYVLSGGEVAALVVIDAVSRLVPGVVGDAESVVQESFAGNLLDFPHYTRPLDFRGVRVPDVLVSGHHAEVRRWRRKAALARTLERRPDLLESAALDEEGRRLLDEVRRERE